MSGVRIIAEAGVNHNGDLGLALELVDVAKAAGADIVKFQTFSAAALATEQAERASYQERNLGETGSQVEMLRALELSHAEFETLAAHCAKAGIEFLSTAFDPGSLDFLAGTIGQRTYKIPSGELTNSPFLLAHARVAEELILSTGMAEMAEIEQALAVVAFGLLAPAEAVPSRAALAEVWASEAGRAVVRERVTVLHCTTDYPVAPEEINLRAMDDIRDRFGTRVGYSDHSAGIAVPIAAVARGAVLIEKHFTLDRELPGPDHRASLEPDELAAMVAGIRTTERALGDGVKRPQPSEMANRAAARKSLVATRSIAAGEPFTSANLGAKRPGTGVSPDRYWDHLGEPAGRDYRAGDLIDG